MAESEGNSRESEGNFELVPAWNGTLAAEAARAIQRPADRDPTPRQLVEQALRSERRWWSVPQLRRATGLSAIAVNSGLNTLCQLTLAKRMYPVRRGRRPDYEIQQYRWLSDEERRKLLSNG